VRQLNGLSMALLVRFFASYSQINDYSLSYTDFVPIADPGNGLSPFLVATDELKEAMKEAIKMATNAFNVMTDHTEDKHVSDMLKLALGDDAEYQTKFDAMKSELSTRLDQVTEN
jgi:hypothetical protein